MRIIILCLAFIFMPQIYALAGAVDAPAPAEKKVQNKKVKKQIKAKTDNGKGMKTSTLLYIVGFIFVIPGAIVGIYGAIAGLSTLSILGLVLCLIGLIFTLIGLIVYFSEKKKSASMDGEDKKEEEKKGMQ